jgi:hypothetical protein
MNAHLPISQRPVRLTPDEVSIRNNDLLVYAKLLLATGGNRTAARAMAEAQRAPDRVQRMFNTKAAVGAGHTGDGDFGEVAGDWKIAQSGFFGFLSQRSVFFALLESGFVKLPFHIPLGAVAVGATAWSRNEGGAIPVSSMQLSKPSLEPIMVAALAVLSREVCEAEGSAAQGITSRILREAVAAEVDREFFDAVAGSPALSFAATGTDATAMREDLLAMLLSVNRGGASLLWAMDPATAARASLVDDPRAQMTPTGGALMGVRAMVSDAIPEGTLHLIDASSIIGNADEVLLDASDQADIEMESEPTSDAATGTGAAMVSMFQTNGRSLRCRVRIGAERLRDGAIATLTDIAWMTQESA